MKIFVLFFALLFLLSGNGFAAEQTIKSTEEMVGSGHATKSDTLNRALLVSHSSDGTHKAGLGDLLNGAANLKAFMNAAATAPEWAAGIKHITSTHDVSVTGTQAFTGAGFKPSGMFIFAGINASSGWSFGFTTTTGGVCVINAHVESAATWNIIADQLGYIRTASGVNAYFSLTSFDADGATITWAKGGSPTGTATILILFFR